MGKLFGTDGVRGVANQDLTCDLAYALGRAGAHVLAEAGHRAPRLLLGRDTRVSGDMLSCALAAGICSVGALAVDVGVISTPGVAYLTRAGHADAGVMISASHNPVRDNGIKFFSGEGFKLSDALEERIEAIVRESCDRLPRPTGHEVGRVLRRDDLVEVYADSLARDLGRGKARVVLDCANGAASAIGPRVFAALGYDVVPLFDRPDGLNINEGCGSTHPEALCRAVAEHGAAMGFALDGDADRMIAVDERGCVIDGDQVMGAIAIDLKERGLLRGDTLVATVMSNIGLEIAMREHGIRLVRAAVGDRYVLEALLAGDYIFGGEQSGHFIHLLHGTTGDGLAAALHLAQISEERGLPLSRVANVMEKVPQVLVNVAVPNERKNNLLGIDAVRLGVERIEGKMSGRGRVLVRPSGTEALVRIMIEGPDRAEIEADARKLAALVEKSV